METAETRLAKTLFVVQATHYEVQSLWSNWSKKSADQSRFRPAPDKQIDWVQLDGWGVQVGELDGMLICVSIIWNKLNGHLIAFWEPTSLVFDHRQWESWINKHFSGTWDNDRKALTNTSNFHHCIRAIEESNGKVLRN